MLDHIGIPVRNYALAKAFYETSLNVLGHRLLMEVPLEHSQGKGVCGFGTQSPQFWIEESEHTNQRIHVAFAAPNRKAVDAFYEAAIAAGAKDNGKPGPRPHYHEHYYGGFVLDLDGNNIEAVCHLPE